MRAWTFSSAMPGSVPSKTGASAASKARWTPSMGRTLKSTPRLRATASASVRLQLAGDAAGHEEGDDVARPERLGGDGGRQGGVDAAAHAEDDLAESALAAVVVQAEHEGAPDVLDHVRLGRGHRRAGLLGVHDHQVLAERGGLGGDVAGGVHEQAAALEDELVVAAHDVLVGDGHAVAGRHGAQHAAAQRLAAGGVGAGGDVDDEAGAGPDELGDRVALVEALGPEALVVPGVLADGQADGHAVQVEGGVLLGGLEVAHLVEDVVVRQQHLVAALDDAAVLEHRGGVGGPPAVGGGGAGEVADDDGDAVGAGGQLADGLLIGAQEGGAFGEVLGGIAAEGQLGQQDQVGPALGGLADGVLGPAQIPLNVADGRVNLSERDFHAPLFLTCGVAAGAQARPARAGRRPPAIV